MECAKCIRITQKCKVKTVCDDCVTCPKCVSIRQNCKTKTTCNKCKEVAKAAKIEAEHKASVEELKELVKTDGKELLKAGNWWSKDAILTALSVDCSIAEEVAKLYPTKRCYSVHTTEIRRHIFKEIEKARKEYEIRQEEIDARERVGFIQTLIRRANELSTEYQFGDYYYRSRAVESRLMKEEHWLQAVQQHPGILEMVPTRYRTYELCLAAMRANTDDAMMVYHRNGENFPLKHVPDEHKSEEMCLAAAAWCNRALWWWPGRHRNRSMYIRATRLNRSVVNTTMPEPFCQDPEIREIAGLPAVQAGAVAIGGNPLRPYSPTDSDVEASLDCAICLEDFEVGEAGICQLRCSHILHEGCIKKWLVQSRSCPKCRKYV